MMYNFEKNTSEVREYQQELKTDNPKLYEIYEKAILLRNPSALKEKTKKQFIELKRIFWWKRYKKFLKFVNNFYTIRYDEFQWDIFKAPIYTWIQTNWWYELDQSVKAENYVYAGFDKIPHTSTYFNSKRELQEEKNLHFINEKDFEWNAELVFCDIANISQAKIFGDNIKWDLETYMINCFEYSEWKKLLALYLSIIFENPEDISDFFQNNNSRAIAQHWSWIIQNSLNVSEIKEEVLRLERQNEAINKMKEIYLQTGILPPFSLEIRIQDEVKKSDIQEIISKNKESFYNKISKILGKPNKQS